MTAVQLELCDPAWTDTDAVTTGRAVARIEAQTRRDPVNPHYRRKRGRRAYRRVHTIRLASQEYL